MENAAAATPKSLQSYPTLCDPIDGSPPGSPVPGILQARTLEWVAISFSNAWKWKGKVKSLSRVRLLATPWTANYQAPPSMGFSRQEYRSGVPLPSPIDCSYFKLLFFMNNLLKINKIFSLFHLPSPNNIFILTFLMFKYFIFRFWVLDFFCWFFFFSFFLFFSCVFPQK